MNPLNLPVIQPNVSPSSMETWDKCPRLFLLRHRFGIISKGYQSAATRGTHIHTLLQQVYGGNDLDKAEAKLEQEVNNILMEMNTAIQEHPEIALFGDTPQKVDEIVKDAALARAVVRVYLQYYPFNLSDWTIVAVERTITRPLLDGGCLKGRLDLILRNKKSGKLWIVDYKTTSSNPSEKVLSYSYSNQVHTYAILVQHEFGELPEGFIHIVIQTPQIKFCPNTNDKLASLDDYTEAIQKKLAEGGTLTQKQLEVKLKVDAEIAHDAKYASPFEKYLDRVTADYKGKFETNPTNPPMIHSYVRYAPDESTRNEFENRLFVLNNVSTTDFTEADFGEVLAAFYRVPSECKFCEMIPFCSSDPNAWEGILQTGQFEIRKPETPNLVYHPDASEDKANGSTTEYSRREN